MKAVVIFFLGLVAMQQAVALQPEARSIVSDIVNTLINLISNTMNNVLEEVTGAIQKIFGLMNDGIDLVNSGIDAILDLINDLEKKALDLGVDITMCVVDQRKLVEELRVKTIANLESTANGIIDGLNEIKNEAVDTFNGYIDVVQTLLSDFKKCGINPICIARVTAEATATSIKLTAELPLLAVRIIRIIGEAVVGGTADMAKITADFTITTVRITTEITSCVGELMPIK